MNKRSKQSLIAEINQLKKRIGELEQQAVNEYIEQGSSLRTERNKVNELNGVINRKDEQIGMQRHDLQQKDIAIAKLQGYIEHSTQQQNSQYISPATVKDGVPVGVDHAHPFRAPDVRPEYPDKPSRSW